MKLIELRVFIENRAQGSPDGLGCSEEDFWEDLAELWESSGKFYTDESSRSPAPAAVMLIPSYRKASLMPPTTSLGFAVVFQDCFQKISANVWFGSLMARCSFRAIVFKNTSPQK